MREMTSDCVSDWAVSSNGCNVSMQLVMLQAVVMQASVQLRRLFVFIDTPQGRLTIAVPGPTPRDSTHICVAPTPLSGS